jgi:DNA modification methylase
MGSGTTGIAAINCNRNFIGIEKEKQYFEVSLERISEKITDNHKLTIMEDK